MSLRYQTGELVMKGDRVLLANDAGIVEFVVDPTVDDPSTRWYLNDYGKGIMISHSHKYGSVFTDPEEDGELEFVGRAQEPGPVARP